MTDTPKPKPTKQHLDVKKPRPKKPRATKTAPLLPEVIVLPSRRQRLKAWFVRRSSTLTLVLGTLIVMIWTVLRAITNGVNFDVVGQIGVAEQWAHGYHAGAQLGSTNYVLKMPLYWLINHLTVLSPHARLIALAVGFNLLTFWLLFVLLQRVRALFRVESPVWTNLSLLWLTTIAGNVFWMDYANSRNLEIVGGLYVLYLSLKLAGQWRLRTLLVLYVVASIVFFADPLQWYVCGVSIVLYSLGRLVRLHDRPAIRYSLTQAFVVLAAAVSAKGLQTALKHFLHVSFLPAPTTPGVLSHIPEVIRATATSTLEIFDADFLQGPHGVNTGRQILNALIAIIVIALVFRLMLRMRRSRAYGPWLMITAIGINYAVYVFGGQALMPDTHRYLIMVPMMLLMIIAAGGERLIAGQARRNLGYAWLACTLLAAILLVGAVAINWPQRFSKDSHIGAMISFMDSQHFVYALAPRETGITTTYFSNDRLQLLPMGCNGDHLMPTNLFYDKAAFTGVETYPGEVPILLQNNTITFGQQVCTRTAIIEQFGVPTREIPVPGYGTALIYRHVTLRPVRPAAVLPPPAQRPVVPTAATLPSLGECHDGTTDVIIAHPDDDLLFMNPALIKQVATRCVRTVYVTAADDGRGPEYWQGRQRGIEAAYAEMAGAENNWSDTTALIDKHSVMVRTLVSKPNVSLVFLRLPDGNVHGEGFASTGNVSLEKLAHGSPADSIKTIDSDQTYTYKQLIQVITGILVQDKPSALYTHINGTALSEGDHSDHRAVGALAMKARILAQANAQVDTFVGYPMNYLVRNLDEAETAQKRHVFDTYAAQDGVICEGQVGCSIESTYGRYLERMYMIVQRQPKLRTRPHQDTARNEAQPHAAPKPLDRGRDVLNLFKL